MVEETKATTENQISQEIPMAEASVDQPESLDNSMPQYVAEEVAAEETPEELTPEAVDTIVPPPVYEEGDRSRFIIIGAAVFIFLLIFVAVLMFIFRGGKAAQKEVTLKYWGLWEESAVFDPLIADYKRINPKVKIEYIKMDPKNYRQKLLARDESTDDRPDIFRFHNTWLPSLGDLVTAIPESVMSRSEFEKTFYPIVQQDLRIKDFYYGLPLEIDGLVLIYNDKLFKAAGIETPPVTWEDVIDMAAKLTVKDQSGKIFTSGIALGTASNIEHFSDILGWMILQNGGSLSDLTSKEAVGALQQYRSFAEPPFNLWNESMPNSIAAFSQEQVAMIFAPSWQILTIKQANPDLVLKVAPLPVVPGGGQLSLASYWVEGVSRYSKNQIEAWKFLRFLTEKENMTKLYEIASKSRLFGEPYSRVDLAPTLVQNEYIGPVIGQAKDMKSMPTVSRTYDDGLNDEIIKYLEDAVNATIKGVSPEEAFAVADKGVKQVFEKYGIK